MNDHVYKKKNKQKIKELEVVTMQDIHCLSLIHI